MSLAKNDNNFNIITRFYDGQKDAVEQMVAEYRQGLELFILGYVHDSQVAEDVASDAFVRLIVKKPDIRELKYFKTYLYTVAKNLAIEHIRKRKRFLPLNEDAPSHQNVEKDVILKEKKESVLSAINQLAGDYRSVLFLRYYEEMSVEEVARVMKKNKKQIYNLLNRARTQIKQTLSEEGIFDED
jgi:RNA polymerase sigma-70 factor (ECF subfamily)